MGVTVNALGALVEYSEPTQSAGGGPLNDLKETVIWADYDSSLDINDDAVVFEEVRRVPATSLQGGGRISEQVDINVPAGAEMDVRITVSALDNSGNESPRLTPEVFRIDKLPPAAPTWDVPA